MASPFTRISTYTVLSVTVIIALLLMIVLASFSFVSPVLINYDNTETRIYVEADNYIFTPDDCTVVSWEMDSINAVFYNEITPSVGYLSQTLCYNNFPFTLSITASDETLYNFEIDNNFLDDDFQLQVLLLFAASICQIVVITLCLSPLLNSRSRAIGFHTMTLIITGYTVILLLITGSFLELLYQAPLASLLVFLMTITTIRLLRQQKLLPESIAELSPFVRLIGTFIFWSILLDYGYKIGINIFWIYSIPVYIWSGFVGFVIIRDLHFEMSERRSVSPHLIATVTALISLVMHGIIFQEYGVIITGDAHLYLFRGMVLFDPSVYPVNNNITTLAYAFFSGLVGATESPLRLVILQSSVMIATVYLFTFTLAKKHTGFALWIGVLVATSVHGTVMMMMLLTEAPFVALHLLIITVMVLHSISQDSIRWWQLLLFGMLCAITFLMRTSHIVLIVPVLIAYFFMIQDNRWKISAIIAGFLIIFIAHNALVYVRTGVWETSRSSPIVFAWPLFANGIYSPQNGDVSAELNDYFRACEADEDFVNERVLPVVGRYIDPILMDSNRENSNIFAQIIPCLTDINGLVEPFTVAEISQNYPEFNTSYERVAEFMSAAYVEGLTARPSQALERMFTGLSSYFVVSMQQTIHPRNTPNIVNTSLLEYCPDCVDRWDREADFDASAQYTVIRHLIPAQQFIAQPYFMLTPYNQLQESRQTYLDTPPADWIQLQDYIISDEDFYPVTFAAWALFIMTTLMLSQGWLRWLVFLCGSFVFYTALITVIGQLVNPRYTSSSIFFMFIIGSVFFWMMLNIRAIKSDR